MTQESSVSDTIETDYLVIGAGSAGCVMAGRLSESGHDKVTVLEAGKRDTNPWIHVPIGYGKTMTNPKVNWMFASEPQEATANRPIGWPRGKVLGGCSSINGLLYIRGQSADYDQWRQMGNSGWGYSDVLPYFRKAEDQENGESTHHGSGGPLRVSNLIERNPLCEAFIESAQSAGYKRNYDFNGEGQEGVGYYQLTTRNARRCSAAVAYLHPARKRSNLRVETEAQVERLIVEGKRVKGAIFVRGGKRTRVLARREVILSAGAVQSPHLLMLSGIGPSEHLQEMGVEVKHDLAGVGQNLQDHYGTVLNYRSRLDTTINDIMLSPLRQVKAGLQYILTRKGPLTISAAQVGAFLKSDPSLSHPDIQFLFQTFSHGDFEEGLHKFSGFANFVCPLRPESRGEVRLRSNNPMDAPLGLPHYFTAEADQRLLVAALKMARKVASQPGIAQHIIEEFDPGPDFNSDEELLQYGRETGVSIAHMIGTCKMGTDPMAVVDPSLKAHGLEGLRVVDASVMPTLISGNTNAPTIMIAEKAADMIKQRVVV